MTIKLHYSSTSSTWKFKSASSVSSTFSWSSPSSSSSSSTGEKAYVLTDAKKDGGKPLARFTKGGALSLEMHGMSTAVMEGVIVEAAALTELPKQKKQCEKLMTKVNLHGVLDG